MSTYRKQIQDIVDEFTDLIDSMEIIYDKMLPLHHEILKATVRMPKQDLKKKMDKMTEAYRAGHVADFLGDEASGYSRVHDLDHPLWNLYSQARDYVTKVEERRQKAATTKVVKKKATSKANQLVAQMSARDKHALLRKLEKELAPGGPITS